jgi:hypothetical protein
VDLVHGQPQMSSAAVRGLGLDDEEADGDAATTFTFCAPV